MNNIYFGQYTGYSLMSWYIRAFTWSKRSHTAAFLPPIETPEDDGTVSCEWWDVIEAWRKGVQRQHWTKGHAPGTEIDIYRVPCSEMQAERFYGALEEKIGAKYDFLGVLSFRLRFNVGSEKRWFCSELVFDAAKRAGIVLLKDIPAYKVYPGLLDCAPAAEFVERLVIPKPRKLHAGKAGM